MSLAEKMAALGKAARLAFADGLDSRTGTEVVACAALLPLYDPAGPKGDGEHVIGEACVQDGQPWKCCQSYNANHNPDIIPGQSPAHGAQYHTTDPKRALPFVQPAGAHDAYQAGDCMALGGKVWRSVGDNNVYAPGAYPQGWEEVTEG